MISLKKHGYIKLHHSLFTQACYFDHFSHLASNYNFKFLFIFRPLQLKQPCVY